MAPKPKKISNRLPPMQQNEFGVCFIPMGSKKKKKPVHHFWHSNTKGDREE